MFKKRLNKNMHRSIVLEKGRRHWVFAYLFAKKDRANSDNDELAVDKATMREFDESCLTAPPVIPPEEIKRIREAAHVSQPVFARYLSTSESTVHKWEAGTKRPSGMALKLLAVIEKHGLKVLA